MKDTVMSAVAQQEEEEDQENKVKKIPPAYIHQDLNGYMLQRLWKVVNEGLPNLIKEQYDQLAKLVISNERTSYELMAYKN